MKKKSLVSIIAGTSLLFASCSTFVQPFRGYSSNGERIYFTATSENSGRIDYDGGFGPGMMPGSRDLACVSCHGEDARGGNVYFHMDSLSVPDIRWSALSGESWQEEEHADEHNDAHEGYGLDEFRNAVVYGRHPDGSYLGPAMPRWGMNDNDLRDLMHYLQTLP